MTRGDATDIHRCTCGHTIDDHQPTKDEWLVGGIAVRETREECTECDCTDFEEEDTP